MQHQFLIEPGIWLGEGKISFSASSDTVVFYTKWVIIPQDSVLSCLQNVEMHGVEGKVENKYTVSQIDKESFQIEIDNETLGTMGGRGVISEKNIAWEFRGSPEFEGIEVYELQDNGDYTFHAEYASLEESRTIIDGKLWKKAAE